MCNEHNCPIHCEMGAWTEYGICDSECGPGKAKRLRDVKQRAKFGGDVCPDKRLESFKDCTVKPCPVSCVMGPWGRFTKCDKTCGPGSKTRARMKLTAAAHGGAKCPDPSTEDKADCNVGPCPIDCELAGWTKDPERLECSKTCGLGKQKMVRKVLVEAKHGGKKCAATKRDDKCNEDACPVDCVVGEWATEGTCSLTCGGGLQKKVRKITQDTENGGKTCPVLEEIVKCNVQKCPVDCKVSMWRDNECDKECGGGTMEMFRNITIKPAFKGKACPALTKNASCNADPCPMDCEMGAWTAYGNCTAECGPGKQIRTRVKKVSAAFGGKGCDDEEVVSDSKACTTGPCPVACVLGPWSSFGKCNSDTDCGNGTKTRSRLKLVEAQHNGGDCPASDLVDTDDCNTGVPCPIDCVMGPWKKQPGGAAGCTKTCGRGKEYWHRAPSIKSQHGGKRCGPNSKTVPCNEEPCPVDCQTSDWVDVLSDMNNCTQMKPAAAAALNGSKSCIRPDTLRKGSRFTIGQVDYCCPRSGEVCSKTCGGGRKQQQRAVATKPAFEGKNCPALNRKVDCNTHACPKECVLTPWKNSGDCSVTCGGGNRTQVRTVDQPATAGGACSMVRSRQARCNEHACPVDCVVSEWRDDPAANCSVPCGKGEIRQIRHVVVPASNGGKACKALSQLVFCGGNPCPLDCKMGPFTTWSECSAKCGPGQRSRDRMTLISAQHGGKECDEHVKEVEECKVADCPPVCKMSDWTDWDDCYSDQGCGNGTTIRTRKVLTVSTTNGQECPKAAENETKTCALQPCPVDCVMGQWKRAGTCSKSCGGGKLKETRGITRFPKFTGAEPCLALEHYVPCNPEPCPVDCKMSEWVNTGQCSKECGGGVQQQEREVIVGEKHDGKECGERFRKIDCNVHFCPMDCEVGDWGRGGGAYGSFAAMDMGGSLGGGYPGDVTNGGYSLLQTVHSPGGSHGSDGSGGGAYGSSAAMGMGGSLGGSHGSDGFNSYGSPAKDASECTKECGGGTKVLTRSVLSPPLYDGNACPALNKTVPCNPQPCPVDCIVSDWKTSGTCSVTCGGGLQAEERSVVTKSQHGGQVCPSVMGQSIQCNSQPCPIDCTVTKWQKVGTCNAPCGGGKQKRERYVKQQPAYEGKKCPSLAGEIECNEMACPSETSLSCVMSEWGPDPMGGGHMPPGMGGMMGGGHMPPGMGGMMGGGQMPPGMPPIGMPQAGNCTKTCGGGKAFEIRTVVKEPRTEKGVTGSPCPSKRTREVDCNPQPCPVNCRTSKWANLGSCSATCGGGKVKQVRAILQPAMYGGKACPVVEKLERDKDCGMDMCPVDCVMSEWTEEGECTKACGRGKQMFTRSVQVLAMFKGKACGKDLQKSEPCNEDPCPVDCQAGPWQKTGDCSASCGGGQIVETKDVLVKAQHGGKQCPAMSRTVSCGELPCPQNCQMGEWTKWGECDAQCGPGQKARTRVVATEAMFGGKECDDDKETEMDKCADEPCPPACLLTPWSPWGECSNKKGCGKGTRSRSRAMLKMSHDGAMCPTPALSEEEECDLGVCTVHCKMSEWSAWTECDSPNGCGAGLETRGRHKLLQPRYGGDACPTDVKMKRQCQMEKSCNQDCEMTAWVTKEKCSRTCGAGVERQERTVEKEAVAGGLACGPTSRMYGCNQHECPSEDCQLGQWNDMGVCSATCGAGFVTQMRHIVSHPRNGGKPCGMTVQKGECNKQPCPPGDCKMTPWTDITDCLQGKKAQVRRVLEEGNPANGGTKCPEDVKLSQTIDCSLAPGSDGAHVSMKHVETIKLDMATAKGEIAELREEVSELKSGGCCGKGSKAAGANVPSGDKKDSHGKSSADCVLSDWQHGACSRTCGSGQMEMIRVVVSPAAPGGKPCDGVVRKVAQCNMRPCNAGDRGKHVRRYVDYDGDTRTDVALIGLPAVGSSGLTMLPVAFSNGRAGASYLDDATIKPELGEFVKKAGVRGVTAVVGDYDGDGRSDIALVGVMVGRKVHWPIPVAFSQGRMGFKVSKGIEVTKYSAVPLIHDGQGGNTQWKEGAAAGNQTATDIDEKAIKDSQVQEWSHGSRKLMGDFDGDGKSDIALLPFIAPEEGTAGATQIPVLFSDGTDTQWKVVAGDVGDFATWCHNTKAAVGDFDGDGKSDIVCTGGAKWETVSLRC
jgi:hypothetical protein